MKNNSGEKHLTYFNLLDSMKTGSCPVCFLLEKTAHGYMGNLLYEHVNDPGVRKKIRDSAGFCNLHSGQIQKFGDGFGLGIIYSDLLKKVHAGLQKTLDKRTDRKFKETDKGIKSRHAGKSIPDCPICIYVNEMETHYISSFLEYFNDKEFKTFFKKSFGLCLPHYRKAMKHCGDNEIKKNLAYIEIEKIESLEFELSEFLRKHDYRFTHEGFGKEGDSWIRAIEMMAGKEGIFRR